MATPSAPPTTLLILGAGGDLTHRLLLPGVATLLMAERERRLRIVGSDRVAVTPAQWKARISESFATVHAPQVVTRAASRDTAYVQADILDPIALQSLVNSCGDGPLVIFFALPPAVTMKCCELLRSIELPEVTRLALEKPFGTDLASARQFNQLLTRVVPEEQIYRIDHFLGVNTVLNLIGLRFANRLLQPVWNSEEIEKVEILYDETLALEGRAGYYDRAGALRDMIQSHLLQVLALIAMESIATLQPQEVQDQKAQVMRAIRLWKGDPVAASRRARYTKGTSQGRPVPDYIKEPGVDPKNMTETLAEITVEVVNNRWAGVPFVLRSGKALGASRKMVVITFRDVAHLPDGFAGPSGADTLVIGLKPGTVTLTLTMNAEGDPLDLEQKALEATLAPPRMQAYGEVLGQILDGSRLLTVRGDSAEECWRIVEPVLAAWDAGEVPMETYAAGSRGPRRWDTSRDGA
ncbi:glucose-6-phosphate dehydrogenase [Nostocoides sp.]|uniref:glucose-6-phosphate dehydrogenase n=1 Tax=Nostocoides sp. TaxID=1917966 RepID=UPI002C974E21|nr:glucose-6-phosphate dehydrogenase [Tetrasphaera sp.]